MNSPETRPRGGGVWLWRDGESSGGDAVLVDVDGVISDADHRQHHLDGRRDWDAFFAAVGEDEPLQSGLGLVDLLDERLVVVLLTARPATVLDITFEWLHRHDVRWDLLVMRPPRDYDSSPDFKRRAVRAIRSAGLEPLLAIDDDRRNIDMYTTEGITAVYMHSGYYEV